MMRLYGYRHDNCRDPVSSVFQPSHTTEQAISSAGALQRRILHDALRCVVDLAALGRRLSMP
jgi:hypothetical protein